MLRHCLLPLALTVPPPFLTPQHILSEKNLVFSDTNIIEVSTTNMDNSSISIQPQLRTSLTPSPKNHFEKTKDRTGSPDPQLSNDTFCEELANVQPELCVTKDFLIIENSDNLTPHCINSPLSQPTNIFLQNDSSKSLLSNECYINILSSPIPKIQIFENTQNFINSSSLQQQLTDLPTSELDNIFLDSNSIKSPLSNEYSTITSSSPIAEIQTSEITQNFKNSFSFQQHLTNMPTSELNNIFADSNSSNSPLSNEYNTNSSSISYNEINGTENYQTLQPLNLDTSDNNTNNIFMHSSRTFSPLSNELNINSVASNLTKLPSFQYNLNFFELGTSSNIINQPATLLRKARQNRPINIPLKNTKIYQKNIPSTKTNTTVKKLNSQLNSSINTEPKLVQQGNSVGYGSMNHTPQGTSLNLNSFNSPSFSSIPKIVKLNNPWLKNTPKKIDLNIEKLCSKISENTPAIASMRAPPRSRYNNAIRFSFAHLPSQWVLDNYSLLLFDRCDYPKDGSSQGATK